MYNSRKPTVWSSKHLSVDCEGPNLSATTDFYRNELWPVQRFQERGWLKDDSGTMEGFQTTKWGAKKLVIAKLENCGRRAIEREGQDRA